MRAKTKKRYSGKRKLDGWLGKKASAPLYELLSSLRNPRGGLVFPDLDRKLTSLEAPLFLSPPPKARGAYFDADAVLKFYKFARLMQHVKGSKWAGRPFELSLWQMVFVAAPVFGWKHSDGRRIIRTLYLEVPKKNGKSSIAAVIGLYLATADGEPGAEVLCAAGDRDQARMVFDVASTMGRSAPALAKRLNFTKNQMTWQERSSFLRVVSAEGKLKAGYNLHGGIVDELLVQPNRVLVDNIEGATAARSQPLVAYLTTAGLDDRSTIYGEKRDYSERVATGEIRDETWHSVIYTIAADQAWDTKAAWRQANPGYDVSVSADFFERKVAQAKANPASINTFLRDHLNVRTGQVTRWLNIEHWDASGANWLHPSEAGLKGAVAYAGLDLARVSDLAAIGLLVPVLERTETGGEVETLALFTRAFTPLGTIEEREQRDQLPYSQWVEGGWLTGVDGNVIDYDLIEDEIYKIARHFELRRLHFDRWGSKQILQHVSDELGSNVVFEMGQGFASMSPALKEFEKLTLSGLIRHSDNPLLRSSINSLAVKQDPAGNIKPDREASTGRIDPFVAAVMAVDGWARDDRGVSAYESIS